ncbi:alpha-N-acetylgalactosaminidase-like [Styela clava]
MNVLVILLTTLLVIEHVCTLDNGLARTPPMGWLAWERFRCNTDCKNYPDSCISEKLFKDMADRLDGDGWKAAGYVQVNIDDCWPAKLRTKDGKLTPDPDRFPNGMKSLADYMHGKDLKLGIYGDMGELTCAGYPGTLGHEKDDAETFASWGIDMLKLDGCYSSHEQKLTGFPLMTKMLNQTGRHILYECGWPLDDGHLPPQVNFTLVKESCNMWRNYDDIQDSFDDVLKIINWFGDHQDVYIPAAGPGGWNDPDMLIGGDFSLSYEQAKLQFGIWAILAAPLLVSVDLRTIDPKMRQMLQNKKVIAIDQDPLGMQGRREKVDKDFQVWVRPLSKGDQAIAVIYTGTSSGGAAAYSFTLSSLNIQNPASKYTLYDVFDSDPPEQVGLNTTITFNIYPQGIVMARASPMQH